MRPEQALGACHAACVLHIRRALNMLIWWTVDGGFADMFVCAHEDIHPGVFRPDGSPPGTIHSLIHTVDKSVYKGSVHRRINGSETAPRRPPQSLELCQRSMVTPCSFTAYTGLIQGPTRRVSQQCAKPALARFVTLFRGYCRMAGHWCQASSSPCPA